MTQTNQSGNSEDTKTIVTVLLLIFAMPVGLIVMWVWPKWKTWVKVLVTVPLSLIFFLLVAGFMIGFMSTVNPQASFQKGRCVNQCQSVDVTQRSECISACTTGTSWSSQTPK